MSWVLFLQEKPGVFNVYIAESSRQWHVVKTIAHSLFYFLLFYVIIHTHLIYLCVYLLTCRT